MNLEEGKLGRAKPLFVLDLPPPRTDGAWPVYTGTGRAYATLRAKMIALGLVKRDRLYDPHGTAPAVFEERDIVWLFERGGYPVRKVDGKLYVYKARRMPENENFVRLLEPFEYIYELQSKRDPEDDDGDDEDTADYYSRFMAVTTTGYGVTREEATDLARLSKLARARGRRIPIRDNKFKWSGAAIPNGNLMLDCHVIAASEIDHAIKHFNIKLPKEE